jgi:transcriptional regulator with XRE-family HTH domain
MMNIRMRPDLNRKEIAESIGWSEKTIGQLFNPDSGYRGSEKLLRTLADHLGVSIEELKVFIEEIKS